MNKKVSVIIPVYNAQNYLKRCMDSVCNQTYREVEIVVVNDGSTDSSEELILTLQKEYANIVYVKQENAGPGVARNRGIKQATGEYLIFIDSDDFVDKEYIRTYVQEMEKKKADVVLGGYRAIDENQEKRYEWKLQQDKAYRYVILGPMGKMVKKEYLMQHEIYFLESKFGEDAYFTSQLIQMTDKIAVIEDAIGYNYFMNKNSITKTINTKQIQIENLLDCIYLKLKEKKLLDKDKEYLDLYVFMYIGLGYLKTMCKKLSYTNFKKEYTTIFKWLDQKQIVYRKNTLLNKKNMTKCDRNNRIITKIFLGLHQMGVGRIFLFLFNKIA